MIRESRPIGRPPDKRTSLALVQASLLLIVIVVEGGESFNKVGDGRCLTSEFLSLPRTWRYNSLVRCEDKCNAQSYNDYCYGSNPLEGERCPDYHQLCREECSVMTNCVGYMYDAVMDGGRCDLVGRYAWHSDNSPKDWCAREKGSDKPADGFKDLRCRTDKGSCLQDCRIERTTGRTMYGRTYGFECFRKEPCQLVPTTLGRLNCRDRSVGVSTRVLEADVGTIVCRGFETEGDGEAGRTLGDILAPLNTTEIAELNSCCCGRVASANNPKLLLVTFVVSVVLLL